MEAGDISGSAWATDGAKNKDRGAHARNAPASSDELSSSNSESEAEDDMERRTDHDTSTHGTQNAPCRLSHHITEKPSHKITNRRPELRDPNHFFIRSQLPYPCWAWT